MKPECGLGSSHDGTCRVCYCLLLCRRAVIVLLVLGVELGVFEESSTSGAGLKKIDGHNGAGHRVNELPVPEM